MKALHAGIWVLKRRGQSDGLCSARHFARLELAVKLCGSFGGSKARRHPSCAATFYVGQSRRLVHLTQHGHRWKGGILDLFFLSHNATRHGHGLAAVLRSRESGGRGKRHAIVNQDGKTCRNTDLIMLQPPSMFSQAGSKSQFGSGSIERVVIFGKETVTNLSESPIILAAEALRKLYKSLLNEGRGSSQETSRHSFRARLVHEPLDATRWTAHDL